MAKAHPTTGEIVTVGETRPVWAEIQAAPTTQAKLEAAQKALQLVILPDLLKPVPMFFVDMPWADDRESAQEEILARLIAADSLEAATSDDSLVKTDDLVGHTITIHSAVARPGTLDEGWGAYLSLMLTIDADPTPRVCNTSAKELCVIAWRAYCEDALPITGLVILKGKPTKGRNQPVGLVIETPL